MKEIMAVIRMSMINQTKSALIDAGISCMTARPALGRGKGLVDMTVLKGAEKGYEEALALLGNTQRLIPKRVINIVVPDNMVEKTVDTIISANHTGKSGDGVVWVMPVLEAVRVRTRESGDGVLDGM
jgi:nitrogen regulatory protein PII 2